MLTEHLLDGALKLIDKSVYETELQVAIDMQAIVNNRNYQDRFLSNYSFSELQSAVFEANRILNRLIVQFA